MRKTLSPMITPATARRTDLPNFCFADPYFAQEPVEVDAGL